jgi:hypothetical protein
MKEGTINIKISMKIHGRRHGGVRGRGVKKISPVWPSAASATGAASL